MRRLMLLVLLVLLTLVAGCTSADRQAPLAATTSVRGVSHDS